MIFPLLCYADELVIAGAAGGHLSVAGPAAAPPEALEWDHRIAAADPRTLPVTWRHR